MDILKQNRPQFNLQEWVCQAWPRRVSGRSWLANKNEFSLPSKFSAIIWRRILIEPEFSCGPSVNDPVLQATYSFYPYLDDIPGPHLADARRRAGRDDIAGQERHHMSNEAYELKDIKNHVFSRGVLLQLAVQISLDRRVKRIKPCLYGGANGREGIEALCPGVLDVLALEV